MTALHQAATTALARIDPDSSLTTSLTALPAWADAAILSGEPNAYFDAAAAARGLSGAQKAGLPSLIASVKGRLDGPTNGEQITLVERLIKIALRVQPGITSNAGKAWAGSLVDSFCRVPYDLLEKGVEAARVQQFQFLNEVGPFINAEIAEPLNARKAKLSRLREIAAAADRAKALPKPCEISDAEHEEHMRRLNTPSEPQVSRGTTAADRACWKAGNTAIDWAAIDAKSLGQRNMIRAMQGLSPMTREDLLAESAEESRAYVARNRGMQGQVA